MKQIKLDLKIGFESLDITAKGEVTTQQIGRYKSTFKGRGLEFDSYRKYDMNNDDASMIDRMASARAGTNMVRQFVEERNMEVFFLIDVSNTMILTSQPKLKCEYAAELASSLAHIISRSEDNVGFALFNDKIQKFILPQKGDVAYTNMVNTLVQADNYGGGYDFPAAIEFCLGVLRKNSLLIIVSDFIGMETGWEEALKLAASQFSVIGLMVVDPIDRKIPEGMGQIAIADPLSNQSLLIDPNMIKPHYESVMQDVENFITKSFQEANAEFTILSTDEPFAEKIIELFKIRAEKWR